eukprot:SAG31_NODE_3887_length_3780_cov_8.208639_1_plen_73_part_00
MVSRCKIVACNGANRLRGSEIPIKTLRTHFAKYGEVANITLCFSTASLGKLFMPPWTSENAANCTCSIFFRN